LFAAARGAHVSEASDDERQTPAAAGSPGSVFTFKVTYQLNRKAEYVRKLVRVAGPLRRSSFRLSTNKNYSDGVVARWRKTEQAFHHQQDFDRNLALFANLQLITDWSNSTEALRGAVRLKVANFRWMSLCLQATRETSVQRLFVAYWRIRREA